MDRPAVIDRLSPRQAKVLRYVVSTRSQPVHPGSCVVATEWSDLPKSDLQARKAFDVLRRFGLVERLGKDAYGPTEEGRAVIAYVNQAKLWQQPPPPNITNKFLYRKDGNQ